MLVPMSLGEPSMREELPPRSVELLLMRIFVQAHVMTADLPRSGRGHAFLKAVLRLLEDDDAHELVLPMRAPDDWAVKRRHRREAVAVVRNWLPTLLEVLPQERI